MSDLGADLAILLPALATGLLVIAVHVPLGQRVLNQGIVFIDLAIAQVAGLGVVLAGFGGLSRGWGLQLAACTAALAGAALLIWTERRWPAVQEALIGVLFVATASVELIILANNPQGGEHLKDLLAGQILWVRPASLIPVALLYAVILSIWFAARARIGQRGFYVLFALAVTQSVQLVGIYLVFASLIVPALVMRGWPGRTRLTAGYGCGAAGYVGGLAASSAFDLPAGPTIVCALIITAIAIAAAGTRSPKGGDRLP